MRFAITARTVARQRERGQNELNQLTALNVRKVTRFRQNGIEALEEAIRKLKIGGEKSTSKQSDKASVEKAEREAEQVESKI